MELLFFSDPFDSFKYLLVIIEEMPTDTVKRTAKTFGVAIGKKVQKSIEAQRQVRNKGQILSKNDENS